MVSDPTQNPFGVNPFQETQDPDPPADNGGGTEWVPPPPADTDPPIYIFGPGDLSDPNNPVFQDVVPGTSYFPPGTPGSSGPQPSGNGSQESPSPSSITFDEFFGPQASAGSIATRDRAEELFEQAELDYQASVQAAQFRVRQAEAAISQAEARVAQYRRRRKAYEDYLATLPEEISQEQYDTAVELFNAAEEARVLSNSQIRVAEVEQARAQDAVATTEGRFATVQSRFSDVERFQQLDRQAYRGALLDERQARAQGDALPFSRRRTEQQYSDFQVHQDPRFIREQLTQEPYARLQSDASPFTRRRLEQQYSDFQVHDDPAFRERQRQEYLRQYPGLLRPPPGWVLSGTDDRGPVYHHPPLPETQREKEARERAEQVGFVDRYIVSALPGARASRVSLERLGWVLPPLRLYTDRHPTTSDKAWIAGESAALAVPAWWAGGAAVRGGATRLGGLRAAGEYAARDITFQNLITPRGAYVAGRTAAAQASPRTLPISSLTVLDETHRVRAADVAGTPTVPANTAQASKLKNVADTLTWRALQGQRTRAVVDGTEYYVPALDRPVLGTPFAGHAGPNTLNLGVADGRTLRAGDQVTVQSNPAKTALEDGIFFKPNDVAVKFTQQSATGYQANGRGFIYIINDPQELAKLRGTDKVYTSRRAGETYGELEAKLQPGTQLRVAQTLDVYVNGQPQRVIVFGNRPLTPAQVARAKAGGLAHLFREPLTQNRVLTRPAAGAADDVLQGFGGAGRRTATGAARAADDVAEELVEGAPYRRLDELVGRRAGSPASTLRVGVLAPAAMTRYDLDGDGRLSRREYDLAGGQLLTTFEVRVLQRDLEAGRISRADYEELIRTAAAQDARSRPQDLRETVSRRLPLQMQEGRRGVSIDGRPGRRVPGLEGLRTITRPEELRPARSPTELQSRVPPAMDPGRGIPHVPERRPPPEIPDRTIPDRPTTPTPPPTTPPPTIPPPTIPHIPPPTTPTTTTTRRRPDELEDEDPNRNRWPWVAVWRQGRWYKRLDFNTGKLETFRRPPAGVKPGRTPEQTYAVVEYDDDPPGNLSVPLGVVDVHAKRGGIDFTRSNRRKRRRFRARSSSSQAYPQMDTSTKTSMESSKQPHRDPSNLTQESIERPRL